MRILVISPGYPPPIVGGLEKQARELNHALVQHADVTIRVLTAGRKLPNRMDSACEGAIVVSRSPFSIGSRFSLCLHALWTWFQVFSLCRRFDVVHVHGCSFNGAASAIVAQCRGIPALVKLPNTGFRSPFGRPFTFRKKILQLLLKRAACLVCLSDESVSEVASLVVEPSRIFPVNNGISLMEFDARIHAQAPCRETTLNVAFVGRLVPQKGVEHLLHAWRSVAATGRSIRLKIVGDGPCRRSLTQLCVDLGIQDSVDFLGHVEDVPGFFASVDLFVLPSLAEGNSNSLLEALAAALPAIVTDVGGSKGILGKDFEEWVVPAGDSNALANAVRKAVELPADELERWGKAMRIRVENEYSIEIIAEKYFCKYRELSDTYGMRRR